ncbi:NADH-quinone oxidoreductase subunit H [Escherichia coli]|uniref:NADH-quinone oxidoreductase subunit H n=1 Tax=Escherichia coli TaxID=562 RepID=UPI0039C85F97
MSAISLINSGVAWFVAAAVLAFLFSFQKALSGWIAGIGGAVGSLYTAAAGFTVLTGAVGVSGALSLVSYDVQISPLNAIWLITLGLCGLFVSLYNIDWHRHAQVKCNGLQINMLMAAAVCAVIASNLGMFVVMAEVMALCAVFLTSNSKEGKLPFDLAEAEQELQEGPLSEYSGSGFGVMKWGISLKQLVVLQMFVGVFIPWGQMETFTAGGLLLALVIAIVKLVVGVLVIALFENSMARLRLDITPRITWAGFGFAFLAFVSLLAA